MSRGLSRPFLARRRAAIPSGSAFTLIELLVVVAIIVLLIAIVLPSLSRAREQARIVKCLSNLRNIAQVGTAYLLDNDDLPWVLPVGYGAKGQTYEHKAFSEYIYGGGMPSGTDEVYYDLYQEVESEGRLPPSITDVYHIPPRHRPLNPYFEQTVSWDAAPAESPGSEREQAPEVPDYFQCPSDVTPYVPIVGEFNDLPTRGDVPSCWSFWGTSYPINWYWPYYYMQAPPGGREPYTAFDAVIGILPNVRGLGRTMLAGKTGGSASRFIMFYENQLNFALEASKPPGHDADPWASDSKNLQGWHGRQDEHVAAFLDGSGRYQRFDTRFVFGDNWSIWPVQPWEGSWQEYNGRVPE